jgi:hypothetical protein
MINRREALSRVAIIMGGTILGADAFASGIRISTTNIALTKMDIAFLNEVAETILPKTKTPGAKEANVGAFMQIMVNDCYETKDQEIFMQGMSELQFKASKAKMGKAFMEATPEERTAFLTELDKEAKEYQSNKKKEDPTHYFTMMKQMTLSGLFTSKIGATEVLRYIAVPGKYEGCVPYTKGEKAWATS